MNKNKFTSPDTSSAENFWNRFIAFALAIFLLNLWSAHHLGTTIGDLSFINGPLGILAVVSFLAQWLTEKEASDFKTRVRKWFLFFLKPPALIFLYAFLLICSSLVSSVTVLSDGTPGKLTVALTPEGNNQGNEKKEELRGSNDVVRFIDSTTPFGRPFYLEVDGYLRKSFDLYPWVGTKIRVREDLTPLPTVLLRIPTAARMFLSGGSVELYIADTGDGQERRLLNTPTDRGSGALMLGPRLAVPNDIVEKWRMELVARNIPKEAAARSLLAWQNILPVQIDIPLVPTMTIEAKFKSRAGKTIASATHTITTEKFQDILLISEEL